MDLDTLQALYAVSLLSLGILGTLGWCAVEGWREHKRTQGRRSIRDLARRL